MYYAPHILQKRVLLSERDEYGRILSGAGQWTDVCRCRMDDNSVQELSDEQGHAYTPKYHIVAEGTADVKAGDEVRCLRKDGTVRGEGRIYSITRLNVLDYTDIWV